MTELLARVSALGALGLLNMVRGPATTTAQSVRLIVAFTKARCTFRLETQKNNMISSGDRSLVRTIGRGSPSSKRRKTWRRDRPEDRSNKIG